MVGVNKNTTTHYFHRLRLLIYPNSLHLEMMEGEILGLLKRNGQVYTVTVANTQTATLLPIIREKVKPDSIVYTDCYRSYDVLDVSEFNHFSFAETAFSD